MNREQLARLLAAATVLLVLCVAALFGWRQQASLPELAGVDPQQWEERFPQHYRSYLRTAEDYGRTAHGGSEAYDRLAENPFRRRAFAGNSFAVEYNAARGHFHAQVDQARSLRTQEPQPGGCINCHAAEAPALIAELGWEGLHALDYDDLRERVHHGSSCSDCHDPIDMSLVLTRPALINALEAQDIDVAALGRQELRGLVCAQCHVEYYLSAEGALLTFPWSEGRRLEDIEAWYDAIGFSDWIHPESGAALLKVQHPETELYGTGVHAALKVTCADCHMPTVVAEGMRISDHWIRSPLMQLEAACRACHRRDSSATLRQRVVDIQDATVDLLHTAEQEIALLIDAIVAGQAAGTDPALIANGQQAHRKSQLRWDFIDAENSTGFHSSLEARRLLQEAAMLARSAREQFPVAAD